MKEEELAYYQAVEDHFCRLRGTPFLFSPKDFAYLRRWWQEGVPLAAVLAGIAECFERKRQEGDLVSSLSYCRHAVARHAKRLAQARVGGEKAAAVDVPAALARLQQMVLRARDGAASPDVQRVLNSLLLALSSLPQDAAPLALAEKLGELELVTLRALAATWPPEQLAKLREEALQSLGHAPLTEGEAQRAVEVLVLAGVRREVGLPRLELTVAFED